MNERPFIVAGSGPCAAAGHPMSNTFQKKVKPLFFKCTQVENTIAGTVTGPDDEDKYSQIMDDVPTWSLGTGISLPADDDAEVDDV